MNLHIFLKTVLTPWEMVLVVQGVAAHFSTWLPNHSMQHTIQQHSVGVARNPPDSHEMLCWGGSPKCLKDYFLAHSKNNMITFGLIKIGKFMLRIILRLLGLLCTCAWRKFPSSAGLMRGFSRQHIEKVASGGVLPCLRGMEPFSGLRVECGTKEDRMALVAIWVK